MWLLGIGGLLRILLTRTFPEAPSRVSALRRPTDFRFLEPAEVSR